MPCSDCLRARDTIAFVPLHVCNAYTGKVGVFDPHGLAVCPECLTVWRSNFDNTYEVVG